MARNQWTRREALQTAAAAIAAPLFIPAHVLGLEGQPAANDRANVAIIGLGGRAHTIAATCLGIPQMRIVAVCDCFAPRCDEFIKWFRDGGKQKSGKEEQKPAPEAEKWASYEEFRRMLDKEKLDGVMIETTTHARVWIAALCMQAGQDAYIEKPMCLTIAEGRQMVNIARKYQRVTQIGTPSSARSR